MADTDNDSNATAPIIEMTYEQWKEGLSIDPNSHSEFYSPTYSTSDKEIDSIHAYDTSLYIVEGSSGRRHEFDPPNVDLSIAMHVRGQRDLTTCLNEIALGLDFLVHAFDDYTVNALEPVTALPL